MNKYIYLLFISIFFLEWKLDFIPRIAKWMPELMFMLAAVIVLAQFVTKKYIAIQGRYLMLFIFTLLLIIVGIVVNTVQPAIIFNGIRNYMKFLPVFLLPAVYAFSDIEIKQQLKFLFILVLIQCPTAIYQKFFLHEGIESGDIVGGTVGNSKILSGLLLWSIAIVFAFYLKQKFSIKILIFLGILFTIPITINETAGSLFLLPLAFIAPLIFVDLGRNRLKYLITTFVSGCVLLSTLVVVYDKFYGDRWGSDGIITLITEGKVIEYETDADKGSEYEVSIGRLAAINRAVETLWNLDPVKLLIGLGMGNVSDSFNDNLIGEYYEKYRLDGVLKHTVSNLMWSFGLIGVMLFFIFWFMVFKDAQYLSSRNDISGVIALGFIGILAMFLLQSIYINVILNNLLGCLFAYISGLLAAQRIWLNTNLINTSKTVSS